MSKYLISNIYFGCYSPSFLVKDLHKDNKNDTIIKYIDESLIELRNSINNKKILKMKFLKMKIQKKKSILFKKSSTLLHNKKR